MNKGEGARSVWRDTESVSDGTAQLSCPACGTGARRISARFCSTCGRSLDRLGYRPADSLRASYHQHRARIAVSSAAAPKWVRAGRKPVRARATSQKSVFPHNINAATATAIAFVLYSLVPYFGILFCPGAIVMGGIGLFQMRGGAPHEAGRHASAFAILTGLLLFCVQGLLWLLLYRVPQL